MITEPIKIAAARGSAWNRVRFQLSIVLLVSVFLPYLFRIWLEGSYDQATGNLYFDADGNVAGAAVLFATLVGAPPLAATDFIVI